MLAVLNRQGSRMTTGTMDYSVQLVGDGDGLICVQLETHDNRWPIRADKHPKFINDVRDLLAKGRRRVSPWSVDANLDCEVDYRVHGEPKFRHVEIDSIVVVYRESERNKQSGLTHTTEYGRVHASPELVDEFSQTLREEIEERLRG